MKTAILIAPGVAVMDYAPAHGLFSMIPDAEVHIVWKSFEPILGGPGKFPVSATTTFDECPEDLDVLFVPAVGPEVHADAETISFLREKGRKARWVTSVCGGALMLAVAGLLDGYRTATHWAYDDLLQELGAEISEERVVVDRNRITSDGGSAAIEHALVMARHLVGNEFSKDMELMMEWNPQPEYCFGVGSPQKAGPERTERIREMVSPFVMAVTDAVKIGHTSSA